MTFAILIVLLAAAALAVHSIFHAPASLRVAEVHVPVADLPHEFDGYTIAVLTDVHYAPVPGKGNLERAATIIRRVEPNLIVFLGDFAASFASSQRLSGMLYRAAIPAMGKIIRGMSAPDGMMAVLGNHDYYFDGPAVIAWLESLGVRVLVNDCVVIEHGGDRLAIAGTDELGHDIPDPYAGCSDLPREIPRIVLAHHPDEVLLLAPDMRADLVLAGHTHGGQVVFPILGALIRISKVCGRHTASGWVPNGRAPLYVSRGIGAQIPLRFNCPPELVIVRLGIRDWGLGTAFS
ncbi:MAG: metallophosphoesterase [Gemmatimonadaceae bacterium]